MRVLGILASPRRDGVTTKLAESCLESYRRTGAEVETVRLCELRIEPCRGCLACRKPDGRCPISDDVPHLLEMLQGCDLVVVATPTYWGNMAAPLKALFDRSVTTFETFDRTRPRPVLKGKRAIIITACAAPFPVSHTGGYGKGAVRATARVLRSAGFTIRGRIIDGGRTGKEPSAKALRRAAGMGQRIR